ncbi:MAG TPA: DciA family protein [Burkholderiales bacterium]|nr:DciA family protein [Burkholderiales bacterium]
MPAFKIGALLGAPELAALSRKARRLAELQERYARCAPSPLARASRVADCRSGTLLVVADNAAVAAKLRQLVPSLLSNMREREAEITGIRIAVQVKEVADDADTRPRAEHAEIENIDVFRALADTLPQSPLKSAVMALIARRER